MGAKDLPIFQLLLLGLFILPILALNYRLKLHINATLLKSVVRMCLQLGFVGLYLEFLFRFNSAVLNVIYLLIMVCIACQSIIRSSMLRLRFLFPPVFFALLIPFSFVLLIFNSVVVQIDNLFDAKYLIPIGGMLLGNCLRSIIIGLTHFYSGIRQEEKKYLFSLNLFGSKITALKPYFKESIVNAITPTMASMATIGLVSLPGMMTGQILGGSIPLVAIKYQIAIMFSIFYTEYFSVVLSIIFSLRIAFDDMDVLNRAIFIPKK
mgnify:CR=1 FL=1